MFVVVALFSAGLVTGGLPARATTWSVNSDAKLRGKPCIPTTGAQDGDTITFTSNITLSDDLPAVQRNITIDGANKILSGNNPYRGLFVAKWAAGTANFQDVSVAIRALAIRNCKTKGGAADIQTRAGGGGVSAVGCSSATRRPWLSTTSPSATTVPLIVWEARAPKAVEVAGWAATAPAPTSPRSAST